MQFTDIRVPMGILGPVRTKSGGRGLGEHRELHVLLHPHGQATPVRTIAGTSAAQTKTSYKHEGTRGAIAHSVPEHVPTQIHRSSENENSLPRQVPKLQRNRA